MQGKDIILDKTYEELTAKEKDRFKPYLRIPKSHVKKSPTAAELEDYKDSKKYAIWIDDVNVKNTELNKYSPSDIARPWKFCHEKRQNPKTSAAVSIPFLYTQLF
ncbi:hypothetical protein H9W95_05210 [Flavobacterium lindanitolerans]|nr:hypothetical protein [Flavobacterium lindanitolerans]